MRNREGAEKVDNGQNGLEIPFINVVAVPMLISTDSLIPWCFCCVDSHPAPTTRISRVASGSYFLRNSCAQHICSVSPMSNSAAAVVAMIAQFCKYSAGSLAFPEISSSVCCTSLEVIMPDRLRCRMMPLALLFALADLCLCYF